MFDAYRNILPNDLQHLYVVSREWRDTVELTKYIAC